MSTSRDVLLDVAQVGDAVGLAMQADGDEIVDWIARTARAVFGAAACSVALLTDDGAELVFTTVAGGAAATVSGMRIPASEGIAGWVATTGQPLAVSDLSSDARFASGVAQATGYLPQAILACPVATEDRLLGVIEILDRDAQRAGSDADLELLSLFARQAALAIEASSRTRRIGEVLLRALAAATDGDVAAALDHLATQHATTDDDGLADAAAAFAMLARQGPQERRLAARLLRDVGGYAARTRR